MRARETSSVAMHRKIAGRVMDLFRYWVKEAPAGILRAGMGFGVFARVGKGWGLARLLRGVTGAESSVGRRRKVSRHHGVAIMDPLEAKVLLSAVISTDRQDYPYGSTANINGSGFAPNEVVELQVLHAPGTGGSNDNPQNAPWDVMADASGNLTTTWQVTEPDAVGATFDLTAVGLTSGETAEAEFTDAGLSAATGGSAISADTNSNNGNGQFTQLTGPVYAESFEGSVGTGKIVLNAPAGFVFDTGGTAPTVALTNGSSTASRNINGAANNAVMAMTSVSATQLVFTITSTSNNFAANTLTWQNIRVRPTNAGTTLSTGNIVTSTGTGNATLSGITNGSTSFGTLTEVAGAASVISFSTQPSATTAGAAMSPSPAVKVVDQFGNVVNGATVSMSLNGGSFASGSTTTATTNSSGIATFSNLKINTAANGYTLAASSTGATAVNSSSFNVIAATPSKLTIVQGPSATIAGVAINPAMTVELFDAFNNPVTGTNSITATLNGGSFASGSTTSVAAVNGVATFSNLKINTATTGYTIGFTSTGLTGATSGSFTVTSAAASTFSFNISSPATAGSAVNLTVQARDPFNNIATGYLGTVHFTSTDPQAVLPADYTFVPGDTGAHLFSGGVTFKTAGSRTVSATDTTNGTLNATSSVVTVNAATASQLKITTGAQALTAGVTSGTITVELDDAFGNAVNSSGTTTVNLATNSAGGVFRNTGDTSTITSVSIASGTSSVSFKYKDTAAGIPTLTVSATGRTSGTQQETVSAAAAAGISFTQGPSNVNVGAAITPAVKVKVVDAFGNVISGATVSMGINSGPAGGGFTAGSTTSASTDATGTATFNNLAVNTPSGAAYTLKATLGALSAVSGSFSATGQAAAFSNLSASGSIAYGTASIVLTGTLSSGATPVPNGETVTVTINGVGVNGTVSGGNGGFSVNYPTATLTASATAYAITYSYAGDGNFTATSDGSTSITVNKATPAISWSNPADIVYGTALDGTQLNATTTIPGGINYTPGIGTVLGGGTGQTLSVSFSPNDSTDYTDATANVTINVAAANTAITVDGAAGSYGQSMVTLVAHVANTQTAATVNEGTVTFTVMQGATVIGTVSSPTVSGGVATAGFSLAGISLGNYSVTATYNPAVDFGGSATATAATLAVNPAAAAFSNLSGSQTVTVGAPSIALSGTLAANGLPVPDGETVAVVIDGVEQDTVVTGGNGSFAMSFNLAGIPQSDTPYAISYGYAGDGNFAPASDASTTLTVAAPAQNQAPVNALPGAQAMAQNGSLVFSTAGGNAISVSDVDSDGNVEQVTLSVNHGVLTLSGTAGLSFGFSDANGTGAGDGTADATMTFRGTVAAIDAALNGMTYTPAAGFSGTDSLSLTSNDLGNSGVGGALTDTDAVTLSINAAPEVTSIDRNGGSPTNGSTVSWTVNFSGPVVAGADSPTSLFSTTEPGTPLQANDGVPIEVGMQFSSSVSGIVTGVRFYKNSNDTGTHIGKIYDPANPGVALATVTFTNETGSGWQQASFSTPVAIVAGKTYVVSYYSSAGYYDAGVTYFNGATTANGPLTGTTGTYMYGNGGGYPGNTSSTNYWVDVVFKSAAASSIWSTGAPGGAMQGNDGVPIEVGTQFASSTSGTVTGVRFYKNSNDTGTHVGNLYDPSNPGVVLATVTFTNETGSGWQQANFSSPVAIVAGKTYIVSYYSTEGFYDASPNSLDVPVTNGPLTATAGAYLYGEGGGFPGNTSTASYWVEPVFNGATPIADNFQLTGAGAAGASIVSVDTGDGQTWTVTATTGGDGALGLNLVDNDSIVDASSFIPLGGAGTSGADDGSFAGQTYLVDKTAPVTSADALSVLENGTLTVSAPGVLANDTDIEPAAELTVNLAGGPAHGVLTLHGDGSLSYVPATNYSGSDSFTYTVTDGAGNTSAATTASITINPIPVIDSVSITPANPGTNGTLTANVTAHDDNGHTPVLAYQWFKNGAAIGGATDATLDLSQAGNGDKHDQITVQVTPSDGAQDGAAVTSAAVTIADTAPVVDSVNITPASPLTNDVLTANVTGHDIDVDTVTYAYQWFLNGIAVSGATGATFNLAAAGNKHDAVSVQVTPNDGEMNGAAVTSSAVNVGDSAPVVDSVAITPATPRTNDVLTANVTSHDADGDGVTYSYQWFKNGIAIGGATEAVLDLSVAGQGDKGDGITVQVTPNDGEVNGAAMTSAAVTIGDTAPVMDSVTITPASPLTNDLLTAHVTSHDVDGDVVTYAFQWFKNGVAISGATGAMLDLSQSGNGDKHDSITVQVTPSDGQVNGAAMSAAAVTVGDSAPVMDSVSITPANPLTNDVLAAHVTSHDADGDSVAYAYQWLKNGNPIVGATSSTMDLSLAGNGDDGDSISVQVTPNDGEMNGAAVTSSAVAIGDTAPVIDSVTITPASPLTNDVLAAHVTSHDVDGDVVTYAYQWFKNGVAIGGATASTLDLSVVGNGDKGDAITVQVTPGDWQMNGAAVNSPAVTIGDTAPVVDSVTITPGNPLTNDVLTANVTAHDADGDTVTYSYQWFKNGIAISGATAATLDLSGAGNGDKGDSITVQVTPNDGETDGAPTLSAAAAIGDTAPVMDSVTISPASPLTNDLLAANVTSHDADGDAVGYTYQWFRNGVAISGATGATLDLSLAGTGDKGDAISVQVTPSDGEAGGAAMTASPVTVGDTAPVIDSVTITPASPLTNDVLTANVNSHDVDGDTVTYGYQWFVNGNAIGGATGATLDLSTVGDKHDQISVQVTPNDGTTDGVAATSAAVTIGDTAPAVDSVAITPASPLTDAVLTAQVTSHDADGDAVTYAYQWFNNGTAIDGATAATLDVSIPGNGDKGDTISVQVTPSDGEIDGAAVTSAAVSIGDTAPVVDSVTISPANPRTGDLLTANVTSHDADADTVSYSYQWFLNGTAIEGATGATLDLSGVASKHDQVTVQVTPNDGGMDGASVSSSAVTIADSAPIIDSITITPANPLTNDLLTANVTSHDADGDGVTYAYQWFLNGVAIDGANASTLDLSSAGNGDKGGVITVQATPNDGEMDGAAAMSSSVTVGDTAAVIDSVSITSVSPLTNDILTANVLSHDADGDSVSYLYQWYLNGNAIDGATGQTLDLSGAGNGDKGDSITVEVTPNDGEMNGTAVTSSAVTIGDTAPVIDSVTITPANSLTNDLLTANVTSHDADGDAVVYSYQWLKNGVAIDGATAATLDLSAAGNGDHGDQITVQVTPNDGDTDGAAIISSAVTISDTAPAIDSVSITPANPLTNDFLTASVTSHDADGDNVAVAYQWFLNGNPIDGATGATLDLSTVGDKHDAVTVQVTPSDGQLDGATVTSPAVTIGDTAPVIDNVTITPANPLTNDVLIAGVTSHDADGDVVAYNYQWFKNGVAIDGATAATLDLSVAGNGDNQDAITVQVTPSDGETAGAAATSAAVTVGDTAPVIDSVTITPANPLTGDVLSAHVTSHDADGDPITYRYQWLLNGNAIEGATGATLDLSTVGDKHDQISVQATPNDGEMDGTAATSATVTISDSAPAIDSVSITPANPLTNDVLAATVSSHDADGDGVTYAYQWFQNGVAIDGATASTLDLSTVGNKGDAITVQVTPNDGEMNGAAMTSSATIIGDTAPVIDTVTITPANPQTNDTLTANVTSHDADGDAVSYTYQWFINGNAIDGATAATLDLSVAGDKGDSVTVQVMPNDGEKNGTAVASSAVTIGDTAPVIDAVSITPATPLTNDILTANVTAHDADGDVITYTYQWLKNGVAINGATAATLDLSTAGNGDKPDQISVQVIPNDGETDGAAVTSSEVAIGDTAPVIDSVTITPASPLTNDILTANVTSHDADGDVVTYTYQWFKNGVAIDGATAATLELSIAGDGDKGDAISVQVTPHDVGTDGAAVTSDETTIADTAPVLDSVTIAPANPLTGNILTANVSSHDVDGDVVTYSYQWYLNGNAIDGATGATLDLSAVGSKHDQITVQATPNDGETTGTAMTSSAVTIADTAPAINTVTITQANPQTNDLLTAHVTSHDADGDAVSYVYQWFKNSVAIDGATAGTLDLSIAGNGDKGDVITVQVTPDDGEMDGAAVTSSSVTIQDTAAVIDSVTITPANPLTNDVLTAGVVSHDVDGDAITYTYQWFKNGVAISGATAATLDLSVPGNGDKGDSLTVQVTPNDGEMNGLAISSAAVTVGDTAPVADSVSITPANPLTGDLLTASVTSHDADNDAEAYAYQWFLNGVAIDGATASTLDLAAAGNGDKGDSITVQVTPGDGQINGAAMMSSAVTVGNTAPVIDSVTISPANPLTNDLLTANVASHDADGDTITYTYQWMLNGNPIAGATSATLDLSTIGGKHDQISVAVTPNDGQVNGAAATSAPVTIGDSAPIIQSVSITPAAPLTNDILTANVTSQDADGDVVAYSYQWFKNGVAIDGATAATLDLAVAGNGDDGDSITVRVTPNDGEINGTAVVSSAISVGDTAPVIDGVSITPASPLTNDILTASVTSHDADGDAVTYSYQWYLNGAAIEGATGATLDLSTVGDKHDQISVQVTPSDGEVSGTSATSAAVMIGDTAPVIDTVTITQTNPLTNDQLTANVVSHDVDGDALSYTYQWLKNGVAISGATSETLDLSVTGNGDKGDQITVQVTPNDGETNGAAMSASPVTVGDTAPVIDSITITPPDPFTNDLLTANVTSHDADGDAIACSFQWFKNGVAISGATAATLDTSILGNGSVNDQITVQVTAGDGTLSGSAATSAAVVIKDSAPVIDSVSVTPANPVTTDLLTANVAGHDADGDAVTYAYQWYINGGPINGATSSTLNLSAIGAMPTDVISVTVTPSDGTLNGTSASAQTTVNPAALSLSGLTNQSGAEAAAINFALGSVSNPGWAENVYSVSINWGDGTTSSFDQSAAGSLGTLSKTYADNGSYTVTVSVQDAHGAMASSTFTAQIANVAPALSLSGSNLTRAGALYTLTLSSSDAGDDTLSSWTINWGDGSPAQTVPASARTFNATTGQWETATQAAHTFLTGPANYTVSATATDEDGTYIAGNSVAVTVEHATVVARQLFYGNSYFSANGDNASIAIDKTALLPGQTASFVNYSSYSKGINGIMVDLGGTFGAVTASDFVVRVGNDNNPSGWATGPAPTVTVVPGAGVNGSAEVKLTWADGAIADEWVQITVVANINTGLAADDVFYFGNAIGDTGNSPTDAMVTSADEDGARNNPANLAVNPASVTDAYDFNRDGKVNSLDQIIARNNTTSAATALQLISLAGGFDLTPAVGSAPSDANDDTGAATGASNGSNTPLLLLPASLGHLTTTAAGPVPTPVVTLTPPPVVTAITPAPIAPTLIVVTAPKPATQPGKHQKQAPQQPASTMNNPITTAKRRPVANLTLGFANLWNWLFYKG